MIGFQRELVGRLVRAASSLALAGWALGCQQQPNTPVESEVAVVPQAGLLEDLAGQCGIDVECKAGGIAEGRASVSGIASVDAFFAAVINFQTKADFAASGIQAELDGIRGDFGLAANADIGAEIKAQANLYAEGGLQIKAEPARCQIDAKATVEANAKCSGEATPPMAMVECSGSCEVEASAMVDCGADVDVQCTVSAPSVECTGTCKGTCTAEAGAMADCSGTCKGECMGTCAVMNAQGGCEGKCEGTCMGSCEVKLEAEAKCEGTCSGECTVTNPEGGCMAAVRARCEGKANASVMCEGRCDGEVTPPMVKAECQASAKADASFNAECTPPSVSIDYQLKVGGGVDVEAQARFVAGIQSLKVRLPRLLASIKGAQVAVTAAGELGVAG